MINLAVFNLSLFDICLHVWGGRTDGRTDGDLTSKISRFLMGYAAWELRYKIFL